MHIAVIADIVRSRQLSDRARAQRVLDAAVARVDEDFPVSTEPLRPTVGDEQQGRFPSLDVTLAWLLLLQLALPDEVQLRFGVGIGHVGTIPSAGGELADGPGWWAARKAIETVHAMQRRAAPNARTWIVAAEGEDDGMRNAAALANAYLLARDELVAGMNDRARRLTYGRCLGVTQGELSRAEGISQPAVSQALTAAGASAVVEGFLALSAGSSS